jgi:hypothetical protein
MTTLYNNQCALIGKAISIALHVRRRASNVLMIAGRISLSRNVQRVAWNVQERTLQTWRDKVWMAGGSRCNVVGAEANWASVVIPISLLTWLYALLHRMRVFSSKLLLLFKEDIQGVYFVWQPLFVTTLCCSAKRVGSRLWDTLIW